MKSTLTPLFSRLFRAVSAVLAVCFAWVADAIWNEGLAAHSFTDEMGVFAPMLLLFALYGGFKLASTHFRPMLRKLEPQYPAADALPGFSRTSGSLWKKRSALLVSGLFLFSLYAQAQVTINVTYKEKTNKMSIPAGDTYVLQLDYSVSSTTGNANGVKAVIDLPDEIQEAFAFVGTVHAPLGNFVFSGTPGAKKLTITFVDPLASGSTGTLCFTLRTLNGTIPNGTTLTTTAEMTATGGWSSGPKTQTIDVTAQNYMCASKKLNSGGAVDNITTYSILVAPQDLQYRALPFGYLNATNLSVVDMLPAGAEFVSATWIYAGEFPTVSGVGTYSAPNITFAGLPDMTAFFNSGQWKTGIFSATIKVKYNTADGFNPGDMVMNSATLTYTPLGGAPITVNDGDVSGTCTVDLKETHTLEVPVVGANIAKSGGGMVFPGQGFSYSLGFENTGNVELENVEIIETIPSNIRLDQTAEYNGFRFDAVAYYDHTEYQTNLNPAYTTYVAGGAAMVPLLPMGEYFTKIKIVLKSPFPPNTALPQYTVMHFKPATEVMAPEVVTNCLSWNSTTVGIPAPAMRETCNSSYTLEPRPSTSKIIYRLRTTPCNGNVKELGDMMTFEGTVSADQGFANAVDPICAIFIPHGFEYIPGSELFDPLTSGIAGMPSLEVVPNYITLDGKLQDMYRWTFPSGTTFPYGTNFKVSVKTILSALLVPGQGYTGSIVATAGNASVNEPVYNAGGFTDTGDWDMDGNTTESFGRHASNFDCYTISVNPSASMESRKWVKGQLDAEYHRYPETGLTVRGGAIDYRLVVKNTGNIIMKNIMVIDIFPFVGDMGVIDLSARNTEWRPYLTGPIIAPSGITIYYSTAQNPCRDDFRNPGDPTPWPAGCVPANWTLAPPADITTVQSVMIDFGALELPAADSVEFYWPMRAPADAPVMNEIAWNSFAFIATRKDNNNKLLAAEPIKVGIEVVAPDPASYGNYVWLDTNMDGLQNEVGTGIAGVRVDLYKDNGNGIADPGTDFWIGFTVTDPNGEYLFPNLDAGDYFAVFSPPAGFAVSPSNVGPNDAIDSDGIITPITTLSVLEEDLTWDLGLFPTLDCDVAITGFSVSPCSYDGVASNTQINVFVSWANGPAGENIEVDIDGLGTQTIDIVGGATSPAFVSFIIPADGLTHTINAAFETTGACADTRNFLAPLPCVPGQCIMDVTAAVPSACDADLYDLVVTLQYTGAPTGDIKITILGTDYTFTPDGLSPDVFTIVGLTANGTADVDVTAAFVNTPACSDVLVAAYDAPVSCASCEATTVVANVDCYGTATGSIEVTSVGGAAPFTVTWDGPGANDGTDAGVASPYLIDNLSAGAYSVTIIDANNCEKILSVSITQPGSPLVISSLPTQVSCNGADDGAINLMVAGGTFPYTFDWSTDGPDAPPANDPEDLTGLAPGTYTVTVTDANGCQTTTSVTITEPAVLTASGVVTDVTCFAASTGAIDLTAAGGTTPYTYDWDNDGPDTPDDDAGDLTGMAAGVYAVTVTDANGCQYSTNFTIGEPASGMSLAILVTNATCGLTNGALNLTVTGNTAPFTYDWDNDGPDTPDNDTEDLSGLGADIYTVTVTDANGCTATALKFVNNLPGPTASITGVNPVCAGGATGSVDLTVAGGTAPLTYDWSNDGPDAPDNDTEDLNNLIAGLYEVTVTDGSGCMVMAMVTLTEPSPIDIALAAEDEGLCGEANGSVVASVSGGTAPYTYDWSNDGPETPDNDGASINNLVAGTYTITVTDFKGCFTTDQVVLTCVLPASIGDKTWLDANANGIQDPGETPIPNVVVILDGTDINGDMVNQTLATDGNGMYLFDNLWPGTYKLTFVTPAGGYVPTTSNDPDATDANDSDADIAMGGMTVFEVLDPGENNPTYDAGYYIPASIGDYAWVDDNANGVQDPGEPGLEGVQVMLIGTDGQGNAVMQMTTTDVSGYYIFDNLVPGTYKLKFTAPVGTPYELTGNDIGVNDAVDSDANEAMGGMTVNEILTSGEHNPTYDAGFYAPAKLGDFVWIDENANGIQDVNEAPLQGVTVKLQDAAGNPVTLDADGNTIVNQMTNAGGSYQFTNLIPGVYKVMFINPDPAKYTLTSPNEGTNDAQDSDPTIAMLMTQTTTLGSGDNDPTLDAGFFVKAKVGDFVWEDLNGNGVQDPGEPGINGATVTLTGTDNQGNPVNLMTTTFGNGMYMFGDLVPGDYKITFTTPAGGYATTEADQGGSDALDSDAGPMGMTPVFTVSSGDTIPTFDAGYYKPAKIGNFVWNDWNANGIQDPNEPGIAGVTVILSGTEGDGDIVNLTTTTDATGMYMFGDQTTPGSTSLVPGTYKLTFETPNGGFVPTQVDDPQANDTNDSDADPVMGGMTVFEILTSGEYNPNYDAGYYIPASIGDYVWKDLNANGIQETDEPGIVNALVTLTGTDGQGNSVTLTTQTDANGYYIFDNLVPGTYKLTFTTPVGCDVATYVNQGGDDTLDSDADPLNGNMTVNEVLISGEHNPTYDAGFYSYASIGNYVWEDYSADGEQDAGEPGIANVVVMLTGTTGNGTAVMLQTTTDANGFYLFDNLVPGTYKLKFTAPNGFVTTLQDTPSGNDIADSDVDPVMGMTTPTVLTSGEDDLTWDAGYFSTDYGDLPNTYGTLNGPSNGAFHVLNPNLLLGSCADAELNGQPDAMAGLMTGGDDNNTGVPVKGTCAGGPDDENGITFVTPLINGNEACISVSAINTSGSTATLQGWIDFNGDGDVLDAGEALSLTNSGLIPNGGVNNALYCFQVPANATFQGGAAFARFRLSPNGGLTSIGQAIGGEVEDYKLPVGKVGNLVWNDANYNGIQNAGEAGINEVPVEMVWAGPDGNIATTADNRTFNTITNLAGVYYFCGVIAGTYKITVLSPAMMTPTRPNQGGNDVLDSDGTITGMDVTMVMETFTIANPVNMPTGENGINDMGAAGILGYADAQVDETHDFGFAFMDYGDLPQEAQGGQSYNTTMAEVGAIHAITPQLMLGTCVDAERDGQPDDDAGVYDQLVSDLSDGDDGIDTYGVDAQDCVGTPWAQVSTSSYLCENKLIVRTINPQGQYTYYVVNGDFSPAIAAAGGLANILGSQVIITGNAAIGAYTGNAASLAACIAQQDGVPANQVVIGGAATITLACFDLPHTCTDDENGVVFETPLVPTFEACIRVTAKNTTNANAVLQGWIDWNGNKQLEVGEALAFTNGGVVPSGGVTNAPFCFTVPAGATFNAGRVYARFRLSPTGGLTPDGPDKFGAAAMPLGEVEDYIEEVGKVGNLVWEDRNFDGLQGNPIDEPGMNGVQVQLMWAGPDGNLATVADNRTYFLSTATINGKNGLYYFCGLIDGTYKLTATTPTDFTPTLINQGTDDELDADDFVNGDVFSWPDVANLVLGENGVSDMPGMIPNFPDAHDDQTHDMGYVALDFGDNPDTYTTTLPNGAHSTVIPGLYMGMGVDSEPNGQPDAESGVVAPGGDDNDPSAYNVGMVPASGDDEDGVRILTPMIPGYEACIEIKTTVQAPNTGAFLSAWIDFNGDGIYQASEKVVFTTIDAVAVNSNAPAIPVGQLTRKYCFNVPADATFTGGAANLRFRLSKTANMPATGLVIFGEVEDYWQPLSIVGNYVWMDSDIEGDQDLPEMMLPNVPIQLRWFGEDGVFNTVDDRLYNTTSDALGVYLYRGLIPGGYRITPLKYTAGIANPDAVEPLDKILTIPNLVPNDNLDSDANPFIPVTIPNLITNFLPLNEDGLKDNNGLNGFPDKNENLSLDMGFITKPEIGAALAIKGVDKATSGTCGHFDVIMEICIKNNGWIPLNMMQATLDLASSSAFGSMFLGLVPTGTPVIVSSTAQQNPVLNGGYNGSSVTTLFNGTSGLLWPTEQVCVRMRFELNPEAPGAPFAPDVQATVTAKAVNFQGVPVPNFFNGGAQYVVTDLSDDGMDPMGTNPYAPGDTGGTDDPTPLTNCWEISQPLVNNDVVHISVDSSCVVKVTEDMVLEGEAEDCTEAIYPLGGYYKVTLKTIPNNQLIPNPVPASYIGQTILVEVEHVVSCNKTWGKIKLEDKLAPKLDCPDDLTIACSESINVSNTGNVGVMDCSNFTTVIDDEFIDFGECASPRAQIVRTWIVTDTWGNQSACSQNINITPFDLDDVVFPDEITVDCETAYNNPNATHPNITGRPSINGAPIGVGGYCSASVSYTDERFEICAGSYTIHRTWKVSNECLLLGPGNPISQIQRIKVKDFGGPQFNCPAAVTVSTDPFSCCATTPLPEMIVSEGCSHISDLEAKVTGVDPNNGNVITFTVGGHLEDFLGNNYWNPDTLAVFNYTQCMPLGVYDVRYKAADECGNVSYCNFELTVADLVPPAVSCDQFTQVALTADGMAIIPAATFDDNTADNCCLSTFEVARMNDNICSDSLFGPSAKFCCSDIGDTILVVFRAFDCHGNSNDCMVSVLVEDKIKPTCSAPAQVAVNCENFDPSLWAYGFATSIDNCCIDTITTTTNYALFDTVCNKGTITRTFRALDCGGNFSTCTQRVVVTYLQDYYVKFPNDVIVTTCDGTGTYGEPLFFGEDCELLGVTFADDIFTVVPDACFKIERTWSIINWCTFNPNLPFIAVPNPNPNAISNHATNLPGPTVSACGTLPPWRSTVVKILPTDPLPGTDYCQFWDANANGYQYKQIIKIIDGQAPTGTFVTPACDNQNWATANRSDLWNEMFWWDNGLQIHDLCEEPTDLCITGTDACSGSNVNIEYLLFLDLDGNGTMETVINSVNTGIAGLGWNNVQYDNASNPNFSGGTSRAFDERLVPTNQKYGFAIQETVVGNNKTACVRWNTQQQQNTYVTPELPHGTHKIKWFITDGCGNNKEYEYTFTVKDCKAPTVVCLNGLSTNIMPTGMITLWASDFLQYTEDNCTPNPLKIGIRKCGTGTGFPVDAFGNPITNVNFTCAELGTQCVELWAIDAAGNADYCETYVIIQDNNGNCPIGDHINVVGALKTEMTDGVEEGTVSIDGTSTFAPPYTYFDLSDADGVYQVMNNVPLDATFVIAPEKDDNPLNGVTTYDLVLISKHILGLEPLNSPYKMIAADANKSGSITTFDIVELRKLILGIYTELPNNTSWRFVDKAFSFPNANNPFQTTFPETISVAAAMSSQVGEDFVGVKVGDVNSTVVANATMQAEERTSGTAIFDVEDREVKVGESFEVTFKAAQQLKGFQFTMLLDGLKAIGTVNGDHVNEGNFNMMPEGAMAVSIDGAQDFTVKFRAERAGKLSNMLGVSGSITRAEAYDNEGRKNIAFRYDGNTIAGVGFELYQNQPNPFVNKTSIGFFLPEATEATLSVLDETGRLVYQQKGQFAKGENMIALDRSLLNTTGLLYYKLETATDSATRKMIQAK